MNKALVCNDVGLVAGKKINLFRVFGNSRRNILPLFFSILSMMLLTRCTSPTSNVADAPSKQNTGDPAYVETALQEDPLPGQLSWMEIKFSPFVFNSDTFPSASFAKPEIVSKALGDYKLSTAYYNSDYQQVTKPDKPGRYGAVVNVQFASGVNMDRYYTLYHYSGDFSRQLDWWRWAAHDPQPVTLHMPAVLGINAAAQQKYADAIGTYVRFGFFQELLTRPYAARLLAGLQESKPDEDPKDVKNDIIVRDREWWLGLKMKLHPVDGFPNKNAMGPEVLPTAAVKMLAVGQPMTAKVSAKVAEEADATLVPWAKTSDEPFGVVLVRNGVVFFNKAYGQSLNDRSHIASITKTYTGILLMMCVERGWISLDDDISKYFPGLKDAKWNKPITVRMLATHTSGLPDLQLDELNDLEEVIKPLLPTIHVGERYSYSETGYSLIGKIMEVVTGKSIAILMKEWLIDPLKLNTEVHGAASDAWSTPMDLAKVGQLLLNKGTYGNVRYFGEATFNQMVPAAGGISAGQGIGLQAEGGDVMSKPVNAANIYERINPATTAAQSKALGFGQLYGHLAASGTTFAIDPTNNLVIVMTRNSPGKDYAENNTKFMRTISANLIH